MKKKEFLSVGEAARALGVSVKTVQRWDKTGLLPVIRTVTNQRRISVAAIEHILKPGGSQQRCAIYARVSSAKQEQDGNLARQAERLQQVARERGYQVTALICEQASSLNEKRRGMKRLFQLIEQQEVDVVLVEYPDRLVRFGFGYLQEAFRWQQVRLEVVEPPKEQSPTEELTQDLLTILTVFSGRLYGGRSQRARQCVEACPKTEESDGTNDQHDVSNDF